MKGYTFTYAWPWGGAPQEIIVLAASEEEAREAFDTLYRAGFEGCCTGHENTTGLLKSVVEVTV